jgi:hypothetical protein
MGGGNGQKSAAKRDRNNAKKMKEAKNKNHAESKAKMEADRTGLKCKICMTTFLITASVRPVFPLASLRAFSSPPCCLLWLSRSRSWTTTSRASTRPRASPWRSASRTRPKLRAQVSTGAAATSRR